MRQHSRHTYAAALTPHLCSSIDATAFKLPRPNRTYSAALTPPLLCCSSHAASFLPPSSRGRLHGAASMIPLSHPAFTPPHVRCSIHAAAFFRRSHAAASMPSFSRCHIYAAEFTPQHARRHFYATACTPPHSRRSHAAALLSRRSIGAAALMLPPRTPPHFSVAASRRQPHAAAFTPSHLRCRSCTAAFALPPSRGRSAGGSGPL